MTVTAVAAATSRHQRAPLLLVVAGLLLLTVLSLNGSGPKFITPAAWVAASVYVTIRVFALWLTGSPRSQAHAVVALVLFGIVRSVDYSVSYFFTPFGVWLIVIGLIGQLTMNTRRTRQMFENQIPSPPGEDQ